MDLKRCQGGCNLWFSAIDLDEDQCIRCAEPWADHDDYPLGLDLPEGPPSHWDLLSKMQVQATRYEIILPFAHEPDKSYVAAVIYQDRGRYWRIDGRDDKFRDAVEAARTVVREADARRLQMLNEEFEKEFGNA